MLPLRLGGEEAMGRAVFSVYATSGAFNHMVIYFKMCTLAMNLIETSAVANPFVIEVR